MGAPYGIIAALELTPEVLVGAGDISTCDTERDEATAQLLDGIAGTVATFGDNAYPDGTLADYTNCYDPTWGRHKARTRPTPGNHEYHIQGAAGYFEYFGSAAGDPGQGWYSYDLGGWHVIVLNSECSEVGGCDPNSPQGKWLAADLAASTNPCKLAYWHKPLFSSGVHGPNSFMKPLWDALYAAGADVILNGHEHLYERFAPQDPNGLVDSTSGIRQFTVGTGGIGLTSIVAIEPNSEVRNDTDHGVLKLGLQPGRYDWAFVPTAGNDFSDNGSGSCGGNVGPAANAGTDQQINSSVPATATLNGSASSDDTGITSYAWTKLSGPAATIDNPGSASTTVTLSATGTYTFRLTVTDEGGLTDTDDVVVTLVGAGGPFSWDGAVAVGSDDAEQLGDGSIRLANGELELGVKVSDPQTIGLRFPNVAIPKGATIESAYVQFRAVSVSSGSANLMIKAQASDNAPTFTTGPFHISNRPTGSQSVAWNPPTWDLANEVGPDQRTADLKALIQEVTGRSGWNSGNALALIFTGSGTRVADAIEGGFAPQLHVVYSVGTEPINQPPAANAGPDQQLIATPPATVTLTGSASDDVSVSSVAWTQDSGPATATIASPASTTTTVSLPVAGTYRFRLTATDGSGLTGADTVQVALAETGSLTWSGAIAAGADDAEQSSAGTVSLTGTDLELAVDGTNAQTVGLRFTNVAIPPGAMITSARVQFRADEVSAGAADLLIQAQASDNAPSFTTAASNISARPRGQQSVGWQPPAWSVVNEAGTPQRTPDLKYLIQEVMLRSGWASGNSLALIITGSGTRTADPFEGSFAPRLTVEYTTSGSPNLPPVANAGPDQTISIPATGGLDGTASSDAAGPGITSYLWRQVSGPPGATIGEPDNAQTSVTFADPGTYEFELTVADGGGLADTDIVRIEAIGSGGPFTWIGAVAAGVDDAEEDASTGKVALANNDLDLVLDTNTNKLVGLRFTNVDIPAGAVIQSAYLQFRSDEIQSGATSLTVQGFASSNLTAFTTTRYGIGNRLRTGSSVAWDPVPSWTATSRSGSEQRTPDLAAIVQEIISLSGWAPNNALGFIITGSGKRTADSYEGGYGTQLVVIYTVPGP